jgi:hypothetical protein
MNLFDKYFEGYKKGREKWIERARLVVYEVPTPAPPEEGITERSEAVYEAQPPGPLC